MRTTCLTEVAAICDEHHNDRLRLLDMALAVQRRFGCVDDAATDRIAEKTGVPRVDVEGIVSFFAFLSSEPKGRFAIRLCNDVIDMLQGAREVAAALENELGIPFGETTPDGMFSLEYASCIGMSDQAPAALVNDVVVTRLRPGAAREMVRRLRDRADEPDLRATLVTSYGGGNNSHDLVRAMVDNNVRAPGPILFAPMEPGAALANAVAMSPAEVIREIKTARLRGRGGAGFPTGMKWEFTRAAGGDRRYLICNADEGEPGTFKDRVLLTERPDLVIEGMTVAGYAIGAREGILYLRGEYAYLRPFLEHVIEQRRRARLLGRDVAGKTGFDFDVRIQMGAGAYICGEETALINSCEGLHGDPRTRPPFPAQSGYRGGPTSVNNVETLCCAARIVEKGPGWFASIGTANSTGTKALSICGDCRRPGIYEVPLGITLNEVFAMCGADRPAAAQVGGPSGTMVGPDAFERKLCFDDLATGGALMVFNAERDILDIVSQFMGFFVHESCGYCTPCRVGTGLLKERIDAIRHGRGQASDLEYLRELGETVEVASRCGLGQTAPHPVLSTLDNFRPVYERKLTKSDNGRRPDFDLGRSLAEAGRVTGRKPASDAAESRSEESPARPHEATEG